MRRTVDFYKDEYFGGDLVIDAVAMATDLSKGPDKMYAKRFRAWITMCYKRTPNGGTKTTGKICNEWLTNPQEAIDFMKSISAGGDGRFIRPKPTRNFAPDNLEFIPRANADELATA